MTELDYKPNSEFLQVMIERGYYNDCTGIEALDKKLMSGVQPCYIGFDATAQSLHVGSLIQIMMLRWFQKNWASTNHSNGWRHDQSWRSVISL